MRSTNGALAAAGLVLCVVVTACSPQPVSEAVDRTAAPASLAVASVPPSPVGSAEASSPSSSAPSTTVTSTQPPPKPGNPTFTLAKETPRKNGNTTEEYRITWSSPKGVADSFLIYGVQPCLRSSKRYDGKPCVVRGMRIPADQLQLLATVPGDQRSATISYDLGEAGPPPYSTILIRSTNEAGNSIFTIVHTENVCFGCVY
jgi:hypothetical protein